MKWTPMLTTEKCVFPAQDPMQTFPGHMGDELLGAVYLTPLSSLKTMLC